MNELSDITVVKKAADLIREHGLARGTRLALAYGMRRNGRDGSMCVLGALARAKYGDAWDLKIDSDPIIPRLAEALHLKPFGSPSHLTTIVVAKWSNESVDAHEVITGLLNAATVWQAEALEVIGDD